MSGASLEVFQSGMLEDVPGQLCGHTGGSGHFRSATGAHQCLGGRQGGGLGLDSREIEIACGIFYNFIKIIKNLFYPESLRSLTG